MAKIKKRETLSEIFAGIAAGTSGVYVFLMFTLFPLYTHDMYFDILGMRYGVYLWISRVFVAFLIFLGVAYFFIDYSENVSSPPAIKRFILAFHPKNIRKYISITDICFFVMILSMTISTLGTYWKEEAFYGNAGRYQGLECWLTYFLAYLGVSKNFERFFASIIVSIFCYSFFSFIKQRVGISTPARSAEESMVSEASAMTSTPSMVYLIDIVVASFLSVLPLRRSGRPSYSCRT